MSRLLPVIARVVLAIAAVLVGFPVLQGSARRLEIDVSAALLRFLGRGNQILDLDQSIAVTPNDGPVFVAALTPACSSIAALIALTALAAVIRTPSPRRRITGWAAALTVVALGNLVRILGSLLVGIWYGRGSLVLFHDVVGAALTYVYILGGIIIMLALMIDPEQAARARDREFRYA